MKHAIRGLFLVAVVVGWFLALGGAARADLADERATEFLTALQHNDFDAASKISTAMVRAGMPKVEEAWQQAAAAYGQLKSFEIAGRTSTQGLQVRTLNLNFDRPSGLAAQIAVDNLGDVAGFYFVAVKASPQVSAESDKVADQRVNEMLKALQKDKFDTAEAHFDSQMKSLFSPAAFEQTWKGRTASLGELTAWRTVIRSELAGNAIRVVNLDFTKGARAFALKIAVNSSGEISGLYFVEAQTEAPSTSQAAPYAEPEVFAKVSAFIRQ